MNLASKYDKIWEECISLCRKYISKCIETRDIRTDFQPGKEEYAINSFDMRRGFYCPSPVLEYIVTNIRRGSIAKRITKVSRISNHYVFDSENKIRIAETYNPNGHIKLESIYHSENVIYGVVFDKDKHVSEISVEEYENGRIKSYFWAFCYYTRAQEGYTISDMQYETYCYDNDGFLDMSLFLLPGNEGGVGRHNTYRFSLDADGAVIGSSMQLLESNGGFLPSSWRPKNLKLLSGKSWGEPL